MIVTFAHDRDMPPLLLIIIMFAHDRDMPPFNERQSQIGEVTSRLVLHLSKETLI